MIVGEVSVFAVESEINRAFERPSLRGLGFFVIHVAGHSYGIKESGQSMLACSYDQVALRLNGRGSHRASFASAAATDIANAYNSAIYLDKVESGTYFGMSESEFINALNSNSVVWAPDGDEAFDDGSHVLQFDVEDQVRLVAFRISDSQVDRATVREVWLSSDAFYSSLREWGDAFVAEWESLPKHR